MTTAGGADVGVDAGAGARGEAAARIDGIAQDTGVIRPVDRRLDVDGRRIGAMAACRGTGATEDGRAIIGTGDTGLRRQGADGNNKKNKRKQSHYERQSASIRYIGAIGNYFTGTGI